MEKWGGDIGSALALIWSDAVFPVRNQVYRVMHHLFQCRSTHEKLILVECLEAAFAAFVVNLNYLTQRSGHFETLKYFGEHHFTEESSHAMGSWLNEGGKLPVAPDSPHQMRTDTMLAMVDDILQDLIKYLLFGIKPGSRGHSRSRVTNVCYAIVPFKLNGVLVHAPAACCRCGMRKLSTS